jgi:O-antigen ligase
MSTLLKSVFRQSNLLILGLILLALLIGAAMPLYAGAMEGHAAKLAAFPALLVFSLLLLYDRRVVLLLILLSRSGGDIFLELTKFGVGGVQIGVGGIINMVVILIAVLFVLEKPQLFPKKFGWMWAPFIIYGVFSVAIAPAKGDAIRDYLGLLSYFAIFICSSYLVRSPEDFRKMLWIVIFSSLLPSLYAVVDVGLHARLGGFRLKSTFSHPNIMASYLVLIISLLLYVLKSPAFALKQLARMTVTAYIGYLLLLLLLTQTRSAWIACFAVFLMYAICFEKKYLFYLLFLPLLILVPAVRERFVDLETGNQVGRYANLNSFAWRVNLWKQALHWYQPTRYLIGYGLESFRFFSTTFFETAGGIEWNAHNVYVQYFFELGIVGLISYLRIFWKSLVQIKDLLKIDRLATYIFSATIFEYLIISASDNVANYLVFNWYFWFSVGCTCSLVNVYATAKSKAGVTTGRPEFMYSASV